MPVAMLVAVTVAPGTGAFDVSRTIPWIEPPPPTWACAACDASSTSTVDAISLATLCMNDSLCDPGCGIRDPRSGRENATPASCLSQKVVLYLHAFCNEKRTIRLNRLIYGFIQIL